MRAAAVQLNSGPDVDANLAAADRHVRAAAADGATLVVLPEKWNVLGTPEHLRAGAEPLDGRAVTWMREAAGELGLDLVGSVAVAEPGEDKLRNVCVHASRRSGDRKKGRRASDAQSASTSAASACRSSARSVTRRGSIADHGRCARERIAWTPRMAR